MRTLPLVFALLVAACSPGAGSAAAGDTRAPGDSHPGDPAVPGDGRDAGDLGGGDPGLGDSATGADAASGDGASGGDAAAGDDPPVDPLAGRGVVEVVGVAGAYQFLEGPAWRAATGDLLFTDIPANTIYRFDGVQVQPFRDPSDNANGLTFDTAGLLLACEHGARRVSRTLGGGGVVTVADSFEGARLNSPNDVVVRQDGTVYFTDPQYGISDPQRELDFEGVFRVAPNGDLSAEWRGPLTSRPNGIALSPDEQTLYVTDTTDSVLRAFDVAGGGALTFRADLAFPPGPDGMAVDARGNLFVTSSAGILVYAPDGTPWGTIPIAGDTPANCAFGDPDARTLYVTAGDTLHRVRLASPGLY